MNKPISIDIFSGWKIADWWQLVIPASHSESIENVRLSNGSTTNRKWYKSIYTWSWTSINGINYNDWLYFVEDGNFKKWVSETEATTIWAIWSHKSQFVNYSNYQIICNWQWKPRVYNWSTLIQLTTQIEDGSNPRFGATLSYATYLAGGWDKKGRLYMSKPSTASTPTDIYAYEWDSSYKRDMQSPIDAMCATMSRLFIFTEKKIEYIDKDTTVEVWGIPVIVSIPFSNQSSPINNEVVVVADDIVFFITKTRQIKTIWYVAWHTDPKIWNISHKDKGWISKLLETLDDDQSGAVWYFDSTQNLAVWHLRSKWYTFNNLCLVYDIIRQEFIPDSGKIFWSACEWADGKIYAGGQLSPALYIDWVGKLDDGNPIKRKRQTPPIFLGTYTTRKRWEWIAFAWMINANWVIQFDVIIDGTIVYTWSITWQDIVPIWWLWAKMISEEQVWWDLEQVTKLYTFNKTVSKGKIYRKWYSISVRFYGDATDTEFYLTICEIYARSMGDVTLSNKF